MKTIIRLIVVIATASVLMAQTSTTPSKSGPSGANKPTVPQMTTTASALKYADLVIGKGPTAKQGDTVVVK
jgi:FKBP-type peptidyl-prolyl cis-trans isomerase